MGGFPLFFSSVGIKNRRKTANYLSYVIHIKIKWGILYFVGYLDKQRSNNHGLIHNRSLQPHLI